MVSPRLLLVDDDDLVRAGVNRLLQAYAFDVTEASNPKDALRLIATQAFDVLVSDLHMPGAGDGLTLVSAMRHANPDAVTLLLSAVPDMAKASEAILGQVDEILTKPMPVSALAEVIRRRLPRPQPPAPVIGGTALEECAALIERESTAIVEAWLDWTQPARASSSGPAPDCDRAAYLDQMLRDLALRLRTPQALGSETVFSMAARQHGTARRRQGAGPETLVEETRLLQIVLFDTIQGNLDRLDPAELPNALMAVADELHAQLTESLIGYAKEHPIAMPRPGPL